MNSTQNTTIVARCSPAGSGAVALIRLSGPDAITITQKLISKNSSLRLDHAPSHTIHYGVIVNQDETPLDQVLFFVMHGPKTFTGEDVVEIGCHNNPLIIQAIIERAVACGAYRAQSGEFCQRAVLHGKMDLLQAESINELIHATNQIALKHALGQMEGTLSAWITSLEQDLLQILSFAQVSFEFIEEEQISFDEQIRTLTKKVINSIAEAKQTFNYHQHLKQGIRIGLIGSTNAGKSSLFNTLISQDKAIVTDIAGTTRDILEATIETPTGPWTLVDTAGIRSTTDQIELLGIEKSRQQAKMVDIILLVVDGSRQLSSDEQELYQTLSSARPESIIIVKTKNDLPQGCNWVMPNTPSLSLSCKTKNGIDRLKELITTKSALMAATSQLPFVLTVRQHTLLEQTNDALIPLIPLLAKNPIPCELIAHHITNALATLSELTGKSVSENAMDHIFRQFCVGK